MKAFQIFILFLALTAGSLRGNELMPNSFSFEILGSAGIYSFNYERIVLSDRNNHFWTVRTGSAFLPLHVDAIRGVLLFPVLTGYTRTFERHGVELSAGVTARLVIDTTYSFSSKRLFPAAALYYRFTLPGSGSFFKAGFTPLMFDRFQPWFGLTVGRGF